MASLSAAQYQTILKYLMHSQPDEATDLAIRLLVLIWFHLSQRLLDDSLSRLHYTLSSACVEARSFLLGTTMIACQKYLLPISTNQATGRRNLTDLPLE